MQVGSGLRGSAGMYTAEYACADELVLRARKSCVQHA